MSQCTGVCNLTDQLSGSGKIWVFASMANVHFLFHLVVEWCWYHNSVSPQDDTILCGKLIAVAEVSSFRSCKSPWSGILVFWAALLVDVLVLWSKVSVRSLLSACERWSLCQSTIRVVLKYVQTEKHSQHLFLYLRVVALNTGQCSAGKRHGFSTLYESWS